MGTLQYNVYKQQLEIGSTQSLQNRYNFFLLTETRGCKTYKNISRIRVLMHSLKPGRLFFFDKGFIKINGFLATFNYSLLFHCR